MQHFNVVVGSTPLGLPGQCGICMHQHSTVAEEEGEEDTPHIDMWRNARLWVDFFGGLHQ